MRTDPKLVAHLYLRAGFGVTAGEAEALSRQSWDDLVDGLLAGLSGPDRSGDRVRLPQLTSIAQSNVPNYQYNGWQEFTDLITWWIQRMVVTDTPLREKLVLLMHNQFPTSFEKVGYASLMFDQNQLFRTMGPGDFHDLTLAVAQDPAMLIWLDANTDHKAAPNQNFARELMERFTMGVGHYSQNDVIAGARAFTGWELDMVSGQFFFNRFDHDNGYKRFLGHRGNLSGEDVVEIVTHHPVSHRFVAARIWSWLAMPISPRSRIAGELARVYGPGRNITALLGAILRHPAFVSATARHGLVKQPIEYAVGALRLLGLSTAALSEGALSWYLGNLGQQPFAPPSVGGWGQNQYWLTTGSALAYLQFAGQLANIADLTAIEDLNGRPGPQVDAVISMLNLPQVSGQTRNALLSLAFQMRQDGGSWPAQQLVTLALVSPEFMAN